MKDSTTSRGGNDMRKQLSLVISLPILLVLAGCAKPQEPSANAGDTAGPSRDETATAPAVADVQIATNAPAGQPPECPAHQDEPADPQRVTAGTYCVCKVPENEGKHPTTNVKGDHMKHGEPVVIGQLADETAVKLGATPLKFTRLEGGAGLSALVSYPHVAADTGRDETMVTHLVNISRWKPPEEGPQVGTCDRTKNVITISYCYWDPKSSDWLCAAGVDGTHLGDVHAQN
jgi:hypothetical protein